MNKLHIALISMEAYATLQPGVAELAGGAGLQIVLLARHLREEGLHISIITGDFGQPPVETRDGIQLVRASRVGLRRNPLRFAANLLRLRHAMRLCGADCYILRATHVLLPPAIVFARTLRATIGFMCANQQNVFPSGRLMADSLHFAALRRTDFVTVQTSDQASALRQRIAKSPIILPNLAPSMPAFDEDAKPDHDIAWIGRFTATKQPHLLVEAARAAPDLRFIVAGGPEQGEVQRYYAVADALRHLSNVTYLGFVPPDKIHHVYRRARVLLNTSLAEGFPNTFLYSWSLGRPVASLHVDPDHVIRDHELGFRNGDLAELLDRIRGFLRHPDSRAEYAHRAKEYVRKYHDPKTVARRFADELLRLLSGGSSHGRD